MSPKKVLSDLVANLKAGGVAFWITEPPHPRMHVLHVVAGLPKRADEAKAQRADANAKMVAAQELLGVYRALPHTVEAAGAVEKAKAFEAAKVAAELAEKAEADAAKYSCEIIRVFGERLGAFGSTWPVRLEMQHTHPRVTTSSPPIPDEVTFRLAFAQALEHAEIKTIIDHIANHEEP